jgi:KDO2-lipid IV(A) lauroyltransferase
MALFTPLKNEFWNEKVTWSRSKYGLDMLPLDDVLYRLKEQKYRHYAVIFGSDQAPRSSQLVRFTTFLNQETAVAYGAERMARDFNIPIIEGTINKVKRGYYQVEFTLVSDDHSKFKKGEITEIFTRHLESAIRKAPEYWLWSHKRWKRSRDEHQVDRII